MTTVKISSSNFYVGNKQPSEDARFLRSLGCHVSGIQEGHSGNVGAIEDAIGVTHRVRYEPTLQGMDSAIVHRRRLKVLSFNVIQVSRRSQVKNIGAPRAASVLRFRRGGEKFCFINTHLNAAVQNRHTGEPFSRKIRRVYEYRRSIKALGRIIRRAKRRGEHIILVGDLNYRNIPGSRDWFFAPVRLFRRHNLRFKAEGVDYVVWSKSLRLTDYEVISRDRHGADHPWLVATFETKG